MAPFGRPANCLYAGQAGTDEANMHAADTGKSAKDRRIGLCLEEQSLAPRVLSALRALGYALEDEEEAGDQARVWLVDSLRLPDLPPPDLAPDLRLLLIASTREQGRVEDPRIFDRTQRPGRLGPIYGMIQRALEQNPRRTPRIPTRLSARCIRRDRRSIGAVLSLSEGGCLLRTGEDLRTGARLNLQFALPDYGLVSTRAECRYRRGDDAGLAFGDDSPEVRQPIAHFVTRELAVRFGAQSASA